MIDLNFHTIYAQESILSAFEKLNRVPENLTLFVLSKDGVMEGTLTDGDIRRGFLRGLQLSDNVKKFMKTEFYHLNDHQVSPREIKLIKSKGVKLLPVLDSSGKIIRVIDFNVVKTVLPIDAVLMAGGRGERLRPLTDTVPKPLLLIGNKTIIENNLDHLIQFGVRDYFITLHYLAEMIKQHCGNGSTSGINIQYVEENEPLGTIGSVSRIADFKHDNVMIMNADLFTNIDLEDFYQEFIDQQADMSIATVPYTVDVPYAVLNVDEEHVRGFREKPTYTYHSNAGIYLIRRNLLNSIPLRKSYHATDFIQSMIEKKKKVIRFPILGYWFDIGKHEDYTKVQELVKHIIK